MLGAICGDIVGRPYEGAKKKALYDFELFTELSRFSDDTVLTVAVCLQKKYIDYYENMTGEKVLKKEMKNFLEVRK